MKLKDFAYGHRAATQVALTENQLPPAVDEFRKRLFRAYRWFIGYAVLVAMIVPPDTR